MALTPRARTFAKLVASGVSQHEARDLAYGKTWPEPLPQSKRQQASKLAARPEVKAAIREYEEQLMPIADYRAVRQEMEQNLRNLAKGAQDERVRLVATRALVELCERREEQQQGQRRRTLSIDALVQEIGAMAAPPQTIELEAASDEAASDDAADEKAPGP